MQMNNRHKKIRKKLETVATGLAGFGIFAATMFAYVYRSEAENMTEAAKATEYYDMRLSGYQTMPYHEKENDAEYKGLKQKNVIIFQIIHIPMKSLDISYSNFFYLFF